MDMKLIAIAVGIIIVIGALAGTIVVSSQPDEARISEVTFKIKTAENETVDESHEFTMNIPGEISLLQQFQKGLNIGPLVTESVTWDTNIDEGTYVAVTAIVDVWWTTSDVDSINYVELTQSAVEDYGNPLQISTQNNAEEFTMKKTDNLPLNPSESDPVTFNPNTYFNKIYYGGGGKVDRTQIPIQALDGATWENYVVVSADPVEGQELISNVNIETSLNVNYNEIDSTLEVSGSVDSIDRAGSGGIE